MLYDYIGINLGRVVFIFSLLLLKQMMPFLWTSLGIERSEGHTHTKGLEPVGVGGQGSGQSAAQIPLRRGTCYQLWAPF